MRRSFLLGFVLLCFAASPARAIDIDGRWGLGVGAGGVIGTTPEFSIFHGHSKRTGWLLDFGISGSNFVRSGQLTFADTSFTSMEDQGANNNAFSFFAGPRIRRFSRPDADFSPYVDAFLQGSYGHAHDWSVAGHRSNRSNYGLAGGLALGAEYFTRWHFSVAAHSTLVSVGWTRNHQEVENASPSNIRNVSVTDNTANVRVSLSPTLFLRTYF